MLLLLLLLTNVYYFITIDLDQLIGEYNSFLNIIDLAVFCRKHVVLSAISHMIPLRSPSISQCVRVISRMR